MANTAFGHDATLTTPGSTTDTALVRWANTSGTSLNNTINILSDGSNITLNARGEVRFSDADSSHYIAFESPATVSTSYTMTLPADLPAADEVLTVTSYSGGAGVLEWAAAGGGTSVAGTTDNGILTFVNSGSTFAAEATLLFDGTLLRIGSAASSSSASFLEITGTMPTHGSIGHVVIQSTDSMAADKGGELLMGGVYTGSSRTAFGGIGVFKENGSDGNYAGYLSLYSRTHGATVAASEGLRINSAGAVTMPTTPCFAAFNGSADSNVTGNNAAATIDFDEEIFDQGDNFANDTFTAPVDGRYEILTVVRIDGVTAASQVSNLAIVSSNRTWGSYQQFGTAISPAGNRNGAIIDMDANDTVTIVMTNGGESSNVHDTGGGATHPTSYMSGTLVA